jgi:hypothetical protein
MFVVYLKSGSESTRKNLSERHHLNENRNLRRPMLLTYFNFKFEIEKPSLYPSIATFSNFLDDIKS